MPDKNIKLHYYGSQCLRGHDGLRYTGSGACVHCVRRAASMQPKKSPDQARGYNLKNMYGLTLDDYNDINVKQDGKCAICGSTPRYSLHVDHCHTTGLVRGLLCSNCNVGIGKLKDDPALLRVALNYLENNPHAR